MAKILAAGLVLLWVFSALPLHAQTRDVRPPKSVGPTSPSDKGRIITYDQPDARSNQRNAWLQGDEKQQEQLIGCFRLSSILFQHAMAIRKMLIVSEVDWKEVQAQYEDLKRGIQSLMEKHDLFSLSLNNGQRSWWERQLQEIMAVELQLQDRTETLDRDLNKEKPGSAQLAKAFTDLEGQFRKWNGYYRQIGADMNIQDLDQQSAPVAIRGLTGAQNPGR
jgi:Skp family chaperone for outer membrane proteins